MICKYSKLVVKFSFSSKHRINNLIPVSYFFLLIFNQKKILSKQKSPMQYYICDTLTSEEKKFTLCLKTLPTHPPPLCALPPPPRGCEELPNFHKSWTFPSFLLPPLGKGGHGGAVRGLKKTWKSNINGTQRNEKWSSIFTLEQRSQTLGPRYSQKWQLTAMIWLFMMFCMI